MTDAPRLAALLARLVELSAGSALIARNHADASEDELVRAIASMGKARAAAAGPLGRLGASWPSSGGGIDADRSTASAGGGRRLTP